MMTLFPLIIFFLLFFLSCSQDQSPHLSIMTHSSFSSEFGPGPHLKREFEKNCQCVVDYKNAGNAGLIVKKLQLGAQADVVMGLDQLSLAEIGDLIKWKKTGIVKAWNLHTSPVKNLLPYDWSPMTFIYRLGEISPPQSWSEFLSNREYKVGLQDPRSSTPGRQLLWWIYNLNSPQGFSSQLKTFHRIKYRVSPSWSTAYGLFKAGKTQMVFSYLSSLFYHWGEEKDFTYQAVSFPSGHPIQVEYMGILESSSKSQLAKDFVTFVLSPVGQSILVKYNFMFPTVGNSPVFRKKLPRLKILDTRRWKDFVTHMDNHIQSWEKSLR